MPTAPRRTQHTPQRPRNRQHPRGRQQHTRQQKGHGSDWERFRDALFRQAIAESGDPWCRLCRKNLAGTPRGGALLDHLIPPARKFPIGSAEYMFLHRDPENLVPVCKRCNDIKGNRLPHELRGWMRDRVEELITEKGNGQS